MKEPFVSVGTHRKNQLVRILDALEIENHEHKQYPDVLVSARVSLIKLQAIRKAVEHNCRDNSMLQV